MNLAFFRQGVVRAIVDEEVTNTKRENHSNAKEVNPQQYDLFKKATMQLDSSTSKLHVQTEMIDKDTFVPNLNSGVQPQDLRPSGN